MRLLTNQEEEKLKVLNFYVSKINTMKSSSIIKQEPIVIKEEKKLPLNKDTKKVKQNSSKKQTPTPKETKPIVKKIEQDVYYNQCPLRDIYELRRPLMPVEFVQIVESQSDPCD